MPSSPLRFSQLTAWWVVTVNCQFTEGIWVSGLNWYEYYIVPAVWLLSLSSMEKNVKALGIVNLGLQKCSHISPYYHFNLICFSIVALYVYFLCRSMYFNASSTSSCAETIIKHGCILLAILFLKCFILFTCCADTGDCLAYFCISDRCCFLLLTYCMWEWRQERGRKVTQSKKFSFEKKKKDLKIVTQGFSLNWASCHGGQSKSISVVPTN